MKIETLIQSFREWTKNGLVELRLSNGQQGYKWVGNALGFEHNPSSPAVKQFQEFFDRKDQNDQYIERYNKNNSGQSVSSNQQYAWFQDEINMIYSFHKCFAMRHRTRLEYYRSDLSQKGARSFSAMNIALGKFVNSRNIAEQ